MPKTGTSTASNGDLTGSNTSVKTHKIRADALLLNLGLAGSRSEAKALLMAGKVRLGTEVIDKAGRLLPSDAPLSVIQPPRFVSRGGEKLEGFLTTHDIAVSGMRALDIGASTGGFTDCLIQRGATHVTCVDVGRNQLHPKIQARSEVTSLEGINARNLDGSQLPYQEYPIIVIDVSFISLKRILLPAWNVLSSRGHLIALVKPQFEAEKSLMDKCRGVIREPEVSLSIASAIRDFACSELPGATLIGFSPSVIQGGDGNQEYLMGLTKQDCICSTSVP